MTADEVRSFHRSLPGYAPTPVHDLGGGVLVKDESSRLGLPAFKILGAAWAADRALAVRPGVRELVAASAGNHGRAVARVARWRGLRGRVFLPARSLPARREAIAAEGAEVVVVDGTYEDAVRLAAAAGREDGVVEIADVGSSQTARDVIDGYATLFAEAQEQVGALDAVLVPVGVGSLAAAAARFGARTGATVVGVEPQSAACLTAALEAGRPVTVDTPGTVMSGMDCAVVSEAAWPDLRDGIARTVLVGDAEVAAAMAELQERGVVVGECGAAPYAALARAGLAGRVLLVATEGRL